MQNKMKIFQLLKRTWKKRDKWQSGIFGTKRLPFLKKPGQNENLAWQYGGKRLLRNWNPSHDVKKILMLHSDVKKVCH